MKPFRKILVPTDFSPQAAEAFGVAHDLARATGASVVVLHVTLPPTVLSVDDATTMSTPADGGGDVCERLQAIRPTDDAVRVEHELIVAARPDVSHVLKIVEAAGCDLIVIGTDGLTGLRHRLFGGLTEAVVRMARCPVLIVKMTAEGALKQGQAATRALVSEPEDVPAAEVTAPAVLQAALSEPDAALHGEYLG